MANPSLDPTVTVLSASRVQSPEAIANAVPATPGGSTGGGPGSDQPTPTESPRATSTPTNLPIETATPALQESPTAVKQNTTTVGPANGEVSQSSPIVSVPTPAAVATSGKAAGILPERIVIPVIGVDVPIEIRGLGPEGEMLDPTGPDVVAWSSVSGQIGRAGNAVFSGHLDWKTRTAVFWRLRQLNSGDEVQIISTDGETHRYSVAWSRAFPSNEAPLSEILDPTEEPAITLITCEGTFNQASHQYSHRRIVRATKS